MLTLFIYQRDRVISMLYWIWFTQLIGIGPVKQRSLLKRFTTPEGVYRATEEDLQECEGIGTKLAQRIMECRSLEESYRILYRADKKGIKIVKVDDALYPQVLKKIDSTPLLFYYQGRIPSKSIGVAVLGTSICSSYGQRVAEDIASFLARYNLYLISGISQGIETYAHTAFLKEGGETIAILANGLDSSYPLENQRLMEEILVNGALLSQFPPGKRPNSHLFLIRSRLIAAWSHTIVIVEAQKRCNSLITANYGREYGKKIVVVPNSVYQEESMGSNHLISKGADIFIHGYQLLPEEDMKDIDTSEHSQWYKKIPHPSDDPHENHTEIHGCNGEEEKILRILEENSRPISLEDLSIHLEIDLMDLIEIATLMELNGFIEVTGSMIKLPMS